MSEILKKLEQIYIELLIINSILSGVVGGTIIYLLTK